MGFLDDYEPVEVRLREFWSQHPKGRVLTALVTDGTMVGEVILFRCDLFREPDDDLVAASGFAHQRILKEPPLRWDKERRERVPNDSAPEWTSPWEVAETSAIGRALANLGYAAKGKRPSREEVSKAQSSGAGSSGSAPAPGGPSSGGGGAAATPEGFGEGSEGVPAAATTPDALALTWERLVERAGAASKARERLNAVSGTSYTPRTVQDATELEISMALASFEDAEYAE